MRRLLITALLVGCSYQSPTLCAEDEAWLAVDHHATDAVEDANGVSRACRNIDDLIDMAFEVAIQKGELHR